VSGPALIAAAVLLVLWVVFVRHTPDALDRRLYSDLHGQPRSGTTRFAARLTALGNGTPLLAVLGALGVLARALLSSWRPLAVAATAVAVGGTASNALKAWADRPRPPRSGWLIAQAGGASFPSGHTTTATAGYLGLATAVAAVTHRRRTRVTVGVLGAAMAVGVGWTRVQLGVHWPSDVLAGWILGAATVATVTAAAARLDRRPRPAPPEEP
jgi:undecaprenyl-diphosphatase